MFDSICPELKVDDFGAEAVSSPASFSFPRSCQASEQ